jgi:hypothetical protein
LAEIYRNAAEVAKERGEEIKLEAIMWGKEAASSFSSTSMFNVERSMFNVHPLLFLAAQPNATTAPKTKRESEEGSGTETCTELITTSPV